MTRMQQSCDLPFNRARPALAVLIGTARAVGAQGPDDEPGEEEPFPPIRHVPGRQVPELEPEEPAPDWTDPPIRFIPGYEDPDYS